MKLIYVKVPVIEESSRAYIVKDEADLTVQLLESKRIFEHHNQWYAKPEKISDGKTLKFHELSKDW